MISTTTLSRRAPAAFLATVLVLAALASAAAAHSLIDIIGDFALAHDAYDGMAHHSRTLAFVFVLAIALVAVLRFLLSALDRPRASTGAFHSLVKLVLALRVWRFAATVAIFSLIGLMAMESADALIDGVRIDDFADLLGGSIPLGVAITFAISACTGVAVSRLLRAVAAAHEIIADIVFALLIGARRSSGSPRGLRTAVSLGSLSVAVSVLSTRAGKRAPPLLLV